MKDNIIVNEINKRHNKLRIILEKENLDAILIIRPSRSFALPVNVNYISGFTGSSAGVFFPMNSQPVFVTDFRYKTQVENEVNGFEIVISDKDPVIILAEIAKKSGLKNIAIERHLIPYSDYEYFSNNIGKDRLVLKNEIIESLRINKSEYEIRIIKEAIEIAQNSFLETLKKLKPGLKEIDVSAELEFQMKKRGATMPSFTTIVVSGYHSALPHGLPSDKVIESGDIVTFDFGAKYKSYNSDITRNVCFGEPDRKIKEIFQIVYEAQKRACNYAKPGITTKQLDSVARDYIREKGYGDYFGHGLGHGLGMEVHEAPKVSYLTEIELKEGMVFTIEPGIYLPGVGGVRIEDNIYLEKNKATLLTNLQREIFIIN